MDKSVYFKATEFNNLKELIYNSANKYADSTAFIIKHKKEKEVEYENITYARFLEEINMLGTALFNLGLQGKRIAIIGRNRYEWALAHFANLLGGSISVPLDKDLQVDELESSLIRSKAEVVIFDEKYIDKIEEVKNRNNTIIKYYVSMDNIEGYKSVHTLIEQGKELLDQGEKSFVNTKIDSNKMSILLFTSGTTSKSKAVMLSQKNITSNVYAMQLVEPIKSSDRNLAFLPFHHIFGSTALVVMLAYGISTAFPDGLKYIAQNLKEYKISLFIGVPLLVEAIYNKVMKEIDKQGKTKIIKTAIKISDFLLKIGIDVRRKLFKQIIDNLGGSLRLVISGGAPLDPKVAKGFNDFGIVLLQGYGLTETSPVIAAEDIKHIKSGSIGRAMTNVELEINNKDENGIGEIRVKGPNVMLGYYENEEATNKVLKDGWFYTGDLAYIDKDGYIFITGRDKDMIVLKNGKKVFPEELETLVNRLEIVKECMVFAMPKGDDVKLSVKIVYDKEVKEEQYKNLSKEELYDIIWKQIKEINKTLPKYKYIKHMILTDEELIKTTTHKVKRQEEMKNILKNAEN